MSAVGNRKRDLQKWIDAQECGDIAVCAHAGCARKFIRQRSSYRNDCKVYCSNTCAVQAQATKPTKNEDLFA